MAAEVSADLALINDEDVLRRMWADTEDFGKKKEIRARMYKLREQRLKDFYTTGDVVTEVTGRKHLTKTHADSISDQGFITMKTKEIRDSESPTRDFSQRAGQGNGYWNSRQENTYASGTDDGARIEMKSNVTEGKGVIKEGNTETQMAMAAHNLHESSEKSDENMSSKSEHHSHASKMVSSSKTDTGDSSSTVTSSAQEEKSSQMKSEQTSTTTSATSSTTKWSTSSTSSSKRVVNTSSSSQNYQITSDQELKSIRDVDDKDYRIITSEDDSKYNRRFTDSVQDMSRVTDRRFTDSVQDVSRVTDSTNSRRFTDSVQDVSRVTDSSSTNQQEQYQTSRVIRTSNRTSSSTTAHDVEDSAPSTYIIRRIVYVTDDDNDVKTNDANIRNTQIINEKRLTEQNERLHETRDTRDDSRVIQQQNIITRDYQDHDDQNVIERVTKTSDTKKFITNEKYDTKDTRTKDDRYVTDNVKDKRIVRETIVQKTDRDDIKQSSKVERTNRTDTETSSAVTDQKIMKEIHKLDSYLSSQSTAPSTPVSPQSVVTDTANWTVVSSKDGEFVYRGEKPASSPKQKAPTPTDSVPTQQAPERPTPASTQEIPVYPSSPTESGPKDSPQSYQPRDKIAKHPSSIDLPKEPTDGQYVTTYQQSYNRISVDNSASHEFFASTLRASPDRSTPSPTKRTPSRGSLDDRVSPERRMRAPSKGSLDRSSPESKPRSNSKGSLVDRSSPERKYKPTPSNTSPERKYKPTSPNFVDRTSPERKYKPTSPNLVDRTSPERKYKPTTSNLVDRTSPERKYKPISPNLVDRSSPERKYKPIPSKKTPDRERRVPAGTKDSPDKTKDTRRKSTDTRSNSLRETTTKTKRKFSSTQTKAANKARASTPGTSPSTSPTRKYRPKETTTTTDSDSDVSHGTYNKSTTNITQDTDIQEKTSVTTIKDTVVVDERKEYTNQPTYPARTTPRDKSPEYSSEGSVSREIRENRIREQPHETSPERRAFAPIKPIPTTVVGQKDVTVNLITNEKKLITDETDKVTEVTVKDNAVPFNRKPDKPDEDQPTYGEQQVTTESIVTKRDDVKITDVTNIETIRRKSPHSSTERIKESSISPERRGKPDRRSPSSSPSPDRARTQKSRQPTQTTNIVTKHHETTTFINEEKRRPRPEKTPDTTKKNQETRRSSKEVTERLTRKPTQPSRPETTQSRPRSESPKKKISSPAESPERPVSSPVSSISPDRPSTTKRPQQTTPQRSKPGDTPTNVTRYIDTDTHKTTIRKIVSSDTPKTPKKSSIPRSESFKPAPKSQTPKDRSESIGRSPLRKPQSTPAGTPQKQRTPLIERTVVTVTKTTTISDKKPIGKPKDSPSQNTVRRIPTSPKKPTSPTSASPAKSTPSYPRKENVPLQKRPKEISQITKTTKEVRRTSEQKENKRPTKPTVEPLQGRHPSSPNKDTKNVKTKRIIEVTDFIDHEKPRDTSDLEDEAPPEEFFAETDDDASAPVPKNSEPLQKTSHVPNIKQTVSRTTKTATVKTSDIKHPKDISPSSPTKPSLKKPVPKAKQILKESTTVNETTKKSRPESQHKVPEDSDTSSESDEELTEEVTIEENLRTTRLQVDQHTINQSSTQDLLNVIVQHPKSSRESSPGYPNARIPVCSTSEDGESIPRYADHISEPEDSDTLERKKPKSYPDQRTIQVTDDDDEDEEETVIHTSVADRVTEFLEAAKQTQETQENTTSQQVQIENSKSVLKAKALFENIAKNQTTVQVSTKPVNIYEVQPESEPSSLSQKPVKPQQKGPKKETPSQPTKVSKPSPDARFIQPEPSDEDDEPSEHTLRPKISTQTYDSVNIQEQINYEEDIYEELEERDTKTIKGPKPQEPNKITQKPKEFTQKPKELTHKPQEPIRKPQEPTQKFKEPSTDEPKKPLDRKPSGTTISVSSKKDFFERKAKDFDKPKAPLKENIDRSKPQKESPQGTKPHRPESVETPDSVTSITEKTESYLRNTVASSIRSQTPDKPHRRDSKPDVVDKTSPTKYEEPQWPESDEPEDSVTTRSESYLRSTVASTVRAQTPDKLHRRGSKPDVLDKTLPTKPRESQRPESVEPTDSLTSRGLVAERTESYLRNTVTSSLRRDSKPDVVDKPSSPKYGRPQRPDSTEPHDLVTPKGLVPERTESYLRNTVASSVRSQTPDKPNRRDSKPDIYDKSPSKYDQPDRPESVEPHDSITTRSESYLRSTVASSVRSQTPEKPHRRDSKPDVFDKSSPTKPAAHEKSPTRQVETGRKPSKTDEPSTKKGSKPSRPEEITRKPSKPEEITRKPSRPEEITRRPSKPDELTRRPSKPEEIVRSPSRPEESPRRVSKEERPTSPHKRPKERSVSPLKSDERMKSPSKVIEITKDVQKTSETLKKFSKLDDTVPRHYKPDDTKSISRVKDVNTTFKHSEQSVEVTKEGKFGVTLRKTPSSTKVTTVTTSTKTSPKKPLAPGELPEVEDIFDLEILEELLVRAVGYDERRRIRAQIRIVKKQLEEEYNTPGRSRTVTTTTTTYTSTIPSVKDIKALSHKETPTSGYALRTTKVTTEETKRRPERISPERQVTRSPERPFTRSPERQSPERQSPERAYTRSPERQSPERRYIDSKKSETKTETVRTYRKESLPKSESPERKRDRISPEKQVLKTTTTTTVERRSPERKPIIKQEPKTKHQTQVVERTTTERRTSADRKVKPDFENTTMLSRSDKTRDSRSEIYETSTTVKSQSYRQVTSNSSTSETKETCPTDSITSSYGVGPTDENGRPLFGLKALRRTNTNKTLGENELEEQQITVIEDETDEIYDSNGRPLFGLKALQATTEEDTMPAQTAQLRELVEKHQQYARESSAKEIKPVQKPKAKLRDSFILTADDETTSGTTVTTTTTTTSHPSDDSTRGLSLRSIIKKHEQISNTGGKVESEMESRSTVVHSQSTVSSDGKVTHKKNIIHGEISSKNGEAPVGKITQKTYSYQTPDDKQSLPTIKSTIKTSTIGSGSIQRRSSGPKIEEIKDDCTSSSTIDTTRRYSKEYTVDDSDTVVSGSTSSNRTNDVRRRSSEINDETVRSYTSILKSSKQDNNDWNTTGGSTTVIRRTSGPKLTEFPAEDGLSSKVIRTTTTTTTKTIVSDKDDKRPLGRGDSVKALQHKFQQATVSSALKQSNVERTDSRGRIQETKSREIITSSPVISTQVKTLEDSQTVKSSPTTVTRVTTITKGPLQEVTTTKVTEVSSKSSTGGATSFLDDTSKVTGVQDILSRMRNADLVTESSDTSEDAEARALLNKFLGASVILQGMEQGMRSSVQHHHQTTTSSEAPSSAALVIQAEKQRVKDANTRTLEDDIDEISDEKQLRILLEACSDYEGRRKIRARLRTIMADHKGAEEISEYTTGLGNNTYGVGDSSGVGTRLNSNNGIDDSGAESGEEIRVLKPEVIQEVQTALSRLENVLPGLDPTKRDAVSQLVNSLQTCLKLPAPNQQPPVPPPRRFGSKKSLRNRHTVGVTREELADARRWIDEAKLKRHSPQTVVYASNDSLANKVFRPVKFVPPGPVIQEKVALPSYLTRMAVSKKQFNKPLLQRAGYFMEPGPQNGILSYIEPEPCLSTDRSTSDTGSLYDYDPSINLFTPEQSVQIAVHKAAINKQISREESRRRDSSVDISSGDEENINNNDTATHKQLSSAQRLLQLATDITTADSVNSNSRNSKKLKMKRSNTIDIPKPSNFYDYSSDDYGDEAMSKAYDDLPRNFGKEKKIIPTFEPKTENDLKFLAFLKQVNQNDQSKVKSYNPCARGGKHWQNRFSSIKTAFEGNVPPKSAPPSSTSSAKLFWENAQNEILGSSNPKSRTPQPGQSKLPWTVKTEENGVVVGSLTVSKPGHVNHFKHAAISAFKPIEKKPSVVSPVSGSVKQIAAQKFSVTPTPDYAIKPEKIYKSPQPVMKNTILSKADNKSFHDLKNFALNSNTTEKTYSSAYFAPKQEQKPRGAVSNKFLNEKNNGKTDQSYSKDNQSTKVWSYTKHERKEPHVSGNAHFKTFENQTLKEPVAQAKPSYTINTGRTLEKSSFVNKNPTERFPAQHWSSNNNSGHYNKVNSEDKFTNNNNNNYHQYGTGNVYSNLPFNGEHLPSSIHGRGTASSAATNRSELNGHYDVRTPNVQNNYQTKTSSNRLYFNDLKSRNGSLVNFTPTSTKPSSKDKQRYSLPENKLIEQYKDRSSNSNESIDRIRPLELRIPQPGTTDNRLPSSQYHPYTQGNDKKPVAVPRPPDSPAELKMPGNIEFCTESPSSYLLSPDDNSCSTPQLYSPYDRVTPNDSQQQKVDISPQFNQYPHSPQNISAYPESSSPMKFTGGYKSPHDHFISISQFEAQHSKSPSVKLDESNGFSTSPYYWAKDSNLGGDLMRSGSNEFCTEEKAVTRVMGQAQCQQAVTINNRTKRRFDSPKNIESELKLQLQQSARQKTLSPSFPNVLQKSESWHQMVKEQMHQAKQAPPLPKLAKAKSTHTLALPKQFEAALTPESVAHKKITVSQYLAKQTAHSNKKQSSQTNRTKSVKENLDDDLENVDEVFESIFQESNKKRNSK